MSRKILPDFRIQNSRNIDCLFEFYEGYVKLCRYKKITKVNSKLRFKLINVTIIKDMEQLPASIFSRYYHHAKYVYNGGQYLGELAGLPYNINYCINSMLYQKTLLGSSICQFQMKDQYHNNFNSYKMHRITNCPYCIYLFLNDDLTFTLMRFYINNIKRIKDVENDIQITFSLSDLDKCRSLKSSISYEFDTDEYIISSNIDWIVKTINSNIHSTKLGDYIVNCISNSTKIVRNVSKIILSYLTF